MRLARLHNVGDMEIKVSHSFITVDDQDKALTFYRDALGLEVKASPMRWRPARSGGQAWPAPGEGGNAANTAYMASPSFLPLAPLAGAVWEQRLESRRSACKEISRRSADRPQ